MIESFLVLKFDMEAILDSHLHLDGLVHLWLLAKNLDEHLVLFLDWWEKFAALDGHMDKIPDRYIATLVRLVDLLHAAKMKWEDGLRLEDGPWRRQLFGEGDEVIVRSPLVDSHPHINSTEELDLDTKVIGPLAWRKQEDDSPLNIL